MRADKFVEAPAEFLPLVRRLLGRTWIVEKLAQAVALSEGAGRGLNFVTLAGELLSAEGTLAVGPRHTSTGLISRRSELRTLRGVIAELASKIESHQATLASLERQVCEADERVQVLMTRHQEVSSALAQQRLQTSAAAERLTELNSRLATLEAELASAVAQRDVAAAQLKSAHERLAAVEAEIADMELRIQDAGQQLTQLETQRSQSSRRTTEQRVGLARSEQQLDSLRRQMDQLTHDQQERGRALADSRTQMEQCTERAGQARRSILHAGGEVAELYLAKEQLTFDALQRQLERDAARLERTELGAQTQRIRHRLRTLDESIHAQDLVAGDFSHQRTALVQRLREDYDIELGELEHEPSAEEQRERDAIEQEIAELRRKINNIGNVNLEALAELEELELRFGSLSTQFSDLTKAKGSLEQIIGRINSDSRRLFAETLEVVRGHFQALFRKLFGGGQADIVLEEGLDILDCGIEIVARPPGKEPRSISLLSGGEKTLTCVALLLAVFRSRPSPFCVLDEVDAALDEANIERFVSVVKDFLSWTQFIIVTHSKKTMTCASTLYGVTMQESGISKRVSVRFEDVSEDGRIHQSALDRDAASAEAAASDTGDETQAA